MLLSRQYITRKPILLALAAMLILLVFALYFYQERTCYTDLSYHLLYYLKDKSLFIQNGRFVAIVTQLPTLLATEAGLPMYAVQMLYSALFVIYYLTVFLLSAYWFRNQYVALVIVLLYVLLAARTFYWAQSELPQALAALLLFYAGISRQAPLQLRFSTLALAALVPVFIFGHPLVIIPFLFIWSYDWLLNRRFKDLPYYGLLLLALGTYQLRGILIVTPGSYEANRMTFLPNLLAYYPNYLDLQSFRNFWQLCLNNFLALPIFLITLSIFYIRQRTNAAWLRLGLMWIFVFGYTLVVNVSYPDNADSTYLENLFLPLTIFVAIPFALEMLPAIERNQQRRGSIWVAAIVGIVLSVRLWVIWHQHIPYTNYQQWMNNILAYTYRFPEHKFVLSPSNVDGRRLPEGFPSWALASETMMISAQHSPDSAQTIHSGLDTNHIKEASMRPEAVFGPFETATAYDLNENYLRFPITPYRLLNTEPPQDTVALEKYIVMHEHDQLILTDSLPNVLKPGRSYSVQIQVSASPEAQPIHSGTQGEHPTLLRAAFYKSKDWPSDMLPFEAPLEVDVWHPWTQNIVLQAPPEPGRYTLEIGIISKNYRDWPVSLYRLVEVK